MFEGGTHDILFFDVDGDGERELITISTSSRAPGIFIFKRSADITAAWQKFAVSEGFFTEGLSIGDVDGDGRMEIICGADLYSQPAGGPYAGHWTRQVYAPTFREMCRTQLADITGNGLPDIIITESEYMDGYLSWYENRMKEDPLNPWLEHRIEENLIYSHTLEARLDTAGKVHVFLAEMEQGGWNAPYNFNARLIEYIASDCGKTWERKVLHQDDGVCGAIVDDIDGDGELEVIGKSLGRYWHNPKIQIWDRQATPSRLSSWEHRMIDRDKPVTGVDLLAVDIRGRGLNDIVCGNLVVCKSHLATFYHTRYCAGCICL